MARIKGRRSHTFEFLNIIPLNGGVQIDIKGYFEALFGDVGNLIEVSQPLNELVVSGAEVAVAVGVDVAMVQSKVLHYCFLF
jgi:hypothetical protein